MPEYARIKDPGTGHQFSMPVGTFDPETVEVLERPAVDPGGEPLPPKYKTSVSSETAKKQPVGRVAAPPKE